MNYRQGDVLIKKVARCAGKERADLILAFGEATGHRHQVIGKARLYMKEGVLYLSAEDEVTLYHGSEEQIERQKRGDVLDFQKEDIHAPIRLPAGSYEILIQREYTPPSFSQKQVWRHVKD